ncbi:hypothetical protein GMAR_ORF88 [Golden Marseillevirus]|uniref:hypothetical protein n=1 Tax=Golden Marseillevirus TaxID=1720526 RepID=UPI000877A89B|nr:hypothetical protein GMAR_ORF88 [Golden Marseillevirus]ALX27463.1 hypothetical protein GMAR_ORF88 [Golden Marseillevirus]
MLENDNLLAHPCKFFCNMSRIPSLKVLCIALVEENTGIAEIDELREELDYQISGIDEYKGEVMYLGDQEFDYHEMASALGWKYIGKTSGNIHGEGYVDKFGRKMGLWDYLYIETDFTICRDDILPNRTFFPSRKTHYLRGKRNGEEEVFKITRKGEIARKTRWRNGKKNGLEQVYGVDCQVEQRMIWEDGEWDGNVEWFST